MRSVLPFLLAATLALPVATSAQDAVRGQRLFNETGRVKGQAVGACAACHADVHALRAMIANRGGRTEDPKFVAIWLDAVIVGAQPGARNAKLQYKGVLSPADLLDLGAYIARAKTTGAPTNALTARR